MEEVDAHQMHKDEVKTESDEGDGGIESVENFVREEEIEIEEPVERQVEPPPWTDLKVQIKIQIIDETDDLSARELVSLSDLVQSKILHILDKHGKNSAKQLSDQLRSSKKIRLLSREQTAIVCDVGAGMTFQFIANFFDIRCPYLASQVCYRLDFCIT